MRSYSIKLDPNLMAGVLIRRGGETETDIEERWSRETEVVTGVRGLQAKACLERAELGKAQRALG
jgi:ribose 1,5-bisphosphokinase PhnN